MKPFAPLLLIALGVVLSIGADIFLKKSGFTNPKFIFYGFLLYGLTAIPVAAAFNLIDFGPVFLIWESLSIIIALVIGSVLFHEPLTSGKIISLLLALAALFFAYR